MSFTSVIYSRYVFLDIYDFDEDDTKTSTPLITIEPFDIVEQCFPDAVQQFISTKVKKGNLKFSCWYICI